MKQMLMLMLMLMMSSCCSVWRARDHQIDADARLLSTLIPPLTVMQATIGAQQQQLLAACCMQPTFDSFASARLCKQNLNIFIRECQ